MSRILNEIIGSLPLTILEGKSNRPIYSNCQNKAEECQSRIMYLIGSSLKSSMISQEIKAEEVCSPGTALCGMNKQEILQGE